MKQPIFALVDCNNFFCSCERVFNPSLQNKPVVVLSNNDGCVIARSQEIKDMGVPMGAPYYKYKDVLSRNGATVFSSNFQLYGDMSHRVMETLRHFTPQMEIYSVDEAFLRLDDIPQDQLFEYGEKIRQTVKQWTGIPVSIGIAPTKTLAKVANYISKKQNKTFNLCSKETQDSILEKFPVGNIWGIGKNLEEFLLLQGIAYAKALRDMDIRWVRKNLSVIGERLVRELRGFSCAELREFQPKKNITYSRSFGRIVEDKDQLYEAIANYVAKACQKMRNQDSQANGIYIFIQTNRFSNKGRKYKNGFEKKFVTPTSDTSIIIKAAKECLDNIYLSGYRYNKVGVMLLDLIPDDQNQSDLFAIGDSEKRRNVMKAIDKINNKFGKEKVMLAIQGTKRTWSVRSEIRSPRYTTEWGELLKVS